MSNQLDENMERFYKSFLSVMHFFHNLAVEISRVSELSLAQFRVLMLIQHFGAMNVNDLREKLNIAQSSTSELIDRLVQNRLIKRSKSPKDKRVTLLELTPRAEKLISDQQGRIKNYYRKILTNLDDKDQTKLVEAFEEIQNIVEKYQHIERPEK